MDSHSDDTWCANCRKKIQNATRRTHSPEFARFALFALPWSALASQSGIPINRSYILSTILCSSCASNNKIIPGDPLDLAISKLRAGDQMIDPQIGHRIITIDNMYALKNDSEMRLLFAMQVMDSEINEILEAERSALIKTPCIDPIKYPEIEVACALGAIHDMRTHGFKESPEIETFEFPMPPEIGKNAHLSAMWLAIIQKCDDIFWHVCVIIEKIYGPIVGAVKLIELSPTNSVIMRNI